MSSLYCGSGSLFFILFPVADDVVELFEPVALRLPLYLQHTIDLSESGRDSRPCPRFSRTVSSVKSSRPDKKRSARTVARVNKPRIAQGWASRWRRDGKSRVLSESMCLKPGSMWRSVRTMKASVWPTTTWHRDLGQASEEVVPKPYRARSQRWLRNRRCQ